MIDYQHMTTEEKLKYFKHVTDWISTEYNLKISELGEKAGLGDRAVGSIRGGNKLLKDEHFTKIFEKFPESKKIFQKNEQKNTNNLPSQNKLIDLLTKVVTLTERLAEEEKKRMILEIENQNLREKIEEIKKA